LLRLGMRRADQPTGYGGRASRASDDTPSRGVFETRGRGGSNRDLVPLIATVEERPSLPSVVRSSRVSPLGVVMRAPHLAAPDPLTTNKRPFGDSGTSTVTRVRNIRRSVPVTPLRRTPLARSSAPTKQASRHTDHDEHQFRGPSDGWRNGSRTNPRAGPFQPV
jgi:hypothetical protein